MLSQMAFTGTKFEKIFIQLYKFQHKTLAKNSIKDIGDKIERSIEIY